ncbi:DUF2065 domain-containing protein [Marilutibacter alkalisoli]|uniref:DUF2065 domain-containing protein n=1 Tax=Marilutibacter alkalisoli TaxID=2591633 RepID=A0A514BRI4_9GAMM|nr:DUF2065 domain-containing protein [Lysobacter alkalisoli]QDH69619.1 DUF2065 domain-containing protein [Lysobacter alkalisoli]
MGSDLLAAVCLVAVLEGLFLFAAPRGWKQAVEQMLSMPDRQLRVIGAICIGAGLLALWWVRQGG